MNSRVFRARRPGPTTRGVALASTLLAVAGSVSAVASPSAWSRPSADVASATGAVTPPGYGFWAERRPQGSAVSRPGVTTAATRFQTQLRGRVFGAEYYRTRGDVSAHRAVLWSNGGHVLRQAVLTARSTPGWQTAYFSHPIIVRSARSYVVGYTTRAGVYFQGRRVVSAARPAHHRALLATGSLVASGGGMPRTSAAQGRTTDVDVVYAEIPRTELTNGLPNADNTGVPPGTRLTTYTGPMTVQTDGAVIDGKTITGDLRIMARNVVIENSQILGDVRVDSDDHGFSFLVKDTTIDAGRALGQDAYDATGIGARDFTALRVEVTGGARGINCYQDCAVRSSWVHGQARDSTGVTHESGIRMGSHSILVDNTVVCDAPNVAPDAGCSADLTGYGDFGPVQDNLILHNLFEATSGGGTCAYGGSSAGKPFSRDAQRIEFVDNIFRRGSNPSDHGTLICGYYATVMDFDEHAPGNLFSGNLYDDGSPVPRP